MHATIDKIRITSNIHPENFEVYIQDFNSSILADFGNKLVFDQVNSPTIAYLDLQKYLLLGQAELKSGTYSVKVLSED